MYRRFTLLLAAVGIALLAGCAAAGGGNSGPPAGHSTSSGVEVFGTIDASVSGVTNKSGR